MLRGLIWLPLTALLMAADEPPPGDRHEEAARPHKTLGDFMKANSKCVDFDDGCSICSLRSGELVCSTPRIACIRGERICAAVRPD